MLTPETFTAVATHLRAMGYCETQALALASDPRNMPRQLAARQLARAAGALEERTPRRRGRPPMATVSADPWTWDGSPPPRWTARHKALVILRVHGGELTIADLQTRYGLSAEEFARWCDHLRAGGAEALRAKCGGRPC